MSLLLYVANSLSEFEQAANIISQIVMSLFFARCAYECCARFSFERLIRSVDLADIDETCSKILHPPIENMGKYILSTTGKIRSKQILFRSGHSERREKGGLYKYENVYIL